METLETLKAARELIELPEHWCQAALTRDGAYCAMGAVKEIVSRRGGGSRYQAYRALDEACGTSIEQFNDSHTHAEVLAAFDAAILKAEARNG